MNNDGSPWNPSDGIELWKHFAQTGGNDKDRMVQVCNWLLALSVGILGAVYVQEFKSKLLPETLVFVILAIFGLLLSSVSAAVALIYGGYANWNWAKADQIARHQDWPILAPHNDPWTKGQRENPGSVLVRRARCLAAPADTYGRLAPIFSIYFGLSLLSAAAHVIVIVALVLRKVAV